MGFTRASQELQSISDKEKDKQKKAKLSQLEDSLKTQADTSGTLGLQGQDIGPQEGPPIQLPVEAMEEDRRSVQVTPQQSQLATETVDNKPPIQQQSPLQASEFTPLQGEVDYSLSDKQRQFMELSPEDRAERENQRVQAFSEYNGILRDLSNVEESLGPAVTERIEDMKSLSNLRNYVTPRLNDLIEYDPSAKVGTETYESELLNSSAKDLELNPKKPIALKKGGKLVLNRTSIATSNKLLGIAKENPNFDIKAFKTDDAGKIINRDEEGVNVQPYIIDESFIPPIVSVAENFLLNQQRYNEAQDLKTSMDSEGSEAAKDGGSMQENISKKALGKEALKTIYREKAYRKGDPTDTFMDDYNNVTSLAFDAVGEFVLELYSSIAPHMVTKTPVLYDPDKNIFTGGELVLTNEGIETIKTSAVRAPDFSVRYRQQPVTDTSPATERDLRKTETGKTEGKRSEKSLVAAENYGNIPSFIDPVRAKIAYMFGIHALLALQTDPETGGLVKAKGSLELLDIGQSRVNKINNIAKKQGIQSQIHELESTDPKNSNREQELLAKRDFRKTLQEKYESPEQKQAELYMHANKVVLQPLSDIAQLGSKPFYHDFVTQKGSERLTAAQTASFQTSHVMRNVIGHGILEDIKPLSSSKAEQAFLWNASTIFFGGGGYVKEKAIKMALFNIKERTPTYLNLVKFGDKLDTYMQSYDMTLAKESVKNLKSTPKGITGVDSLVGGLPQEMLADSEFMAFITALSQGKNAHKHFIQYMDYMIALSKYDKAMKSKTSFRSSVNSVEVDGISNGLTSILMMLGVEDVMYRTGVLRAEGEEKVLGIWKDAASAGTNIQEAYEGNLRKQLSMALQNNMSNEISSSALLHPKNMEKFGYTSEDFNSLRAILTEALTDEGSFLKPPLMTFPYGQEMKNLIGSVYETILLNPKLEAMVLAQFGDLLTGAEFIESIRLPAVQATLGPRVVEFAQLSKDSVSLSNIFNSVIELPHPSGGTTKIAGRSTVRDPKGTKVNLTTSTTVDPSKGKLTAAMDKLTQERLDKSKRIVEKLESSLAQAVQNEDTQAISNLESRIAQEKKKLANRESLRKGANKSSLVVYKTISQVDPFEGKGSLLGGVARGMTLPTIAHSFDAAAMTSLGSGPAMDALRKDADGQLWMLPIYDAQITSLRSLDKTVRLINDNWKNNIGQSTMLEKMDSDLNQNVSTGIKEFNRLAVEKGNMPIDESQYGKLMDFLSFELNSFDKSSPKIGMAKSFSGRIRSNINREGVEQNPNRTYKELFDAQMFLLENKYGDTRSRLKTLVKDSAIDRAKLLAKIDSDKEKYGHEVLQYAMDDIGIPTNAAKLLEQ